MHWGVKILLEPEGSAGQNHTSHQHRVKVWVVACLFCSRIEDCVAEGRSQRPLELYKSRKMFRRNLTCVTSENLVVLINAKIMGK